jgi:Cu+-exporting ATPase
MVQDPVCGMKIKGGDNDLKVKHKGQTYEFCSEDCKTMFKASPSSYDSQDSALKKKKART